MFCSGGGDGWGPNGGPGGNKRPRQPSGGGAPRSSSSKLSKTDRADELLRMLRRLAPEDRQFFDGLVGEAKAVKAADGGGSHRQWCAWLLSRLERPEVGRALRALAACANAFDSSPPYLFLPI